MRIFALEPVKNTEYSKALADPRWQKKRLEKMQAAEWKCEICGDETEELHVHHISYRKDFRGDFVNPWEYELDELKCLCKTCHTIWHLDLHKVRAHCERVAVKIQYKNKCIFDRTLRLVSGIPIDKLYDDEGRKELIKLQLSIRQEYADFHMSVRSRVREIYNASKQRMEAAE